jgi:glucose/arabinose dehydrogenase
MRPDTPTSHRTTQQEQQLTTSLPRTHAMVHVLAADLADPTSHETIPDSSPVTKRRLGRLAEAAGLNAPDVASETTSRQVQRTVMRRFLRTRPP